MEKSDAFELAEKKMQPWMPASLENGLPEMSNRVDSSAYLNLPLELHRQITSQLEFLDLRSLRNSCTTLRYVISDDEFSQSKTKWLGKLSSAELRGTFASTGRLPCFACGLVLPIDRFAEDRKWFAAADAEAVAGVGRRAERCCMHCIWDVALIGHVAWYNDSPLIKCACCSRVRKVYLYQPGLEVKQYCRRCGFFVQRPYLLLLWAVELGLPLLLLGWAATCDPRGFYQNSHAQTIFIVIPAISIALCAITRLVTHLQWRSTRNWFFILSILFAAIAWPVVILSHNDVFLYDTAVQDNPAVLDKLTTLQTLAKAVGAVGIALPWIWIIMWITIDRRRARLLKKTRRRRMHEEESDPEGRHNRRSWWRRNNTSNDRSNSRRSSTSSNTTTTTTSTRRSLSRSHSRRLWRSERR